MKHSSSLLRVLLAAAVALVGMAGTASASTTIAVRKCSVYACDSALSLKNEARVAYANLPLGSIVFVSSQQYPLSAFVRICPGPRGGKDACLITSGDLGAVELDNEVYARAAAIEPIDIPTDFGRSATQATPELVEGHVLSILVSTGRNGINPWHNLFNPLTWPWMEFIDTPNAHYSTGLCQGPNHVEVCRRLVGAGGNDGSSGAVRALLSLSPGHDPLAEWRAARTAPVASGCAELAAEFSSRRLGSPARSWTRCRSAIARSCFRTANSCWVTASSTAIFADRKCPAAKSGAISGRGRRQ